MRSLRVQRLTVVNPLCNPNSVGISGDLSRFVRELDDRDSVAVRHLDHDIEWRGSKVVGQVGADTKGHLSVDLVGFEEAADVTHLCGVEAIGEDEGLGGEVDSEFTVVSGHAACPCQGAPGVVANAAVASSEETVEVSQERFGAKGVCEGDADVSLEGVEPIFQDVSVGVPHSFQGRVSHEDLVGLGADRLQVMPVGQVDTACAQKGGEEGGSFREKIDDYVVSQAAVASSKSEVRNGLADQLRDLLRGSDSIDSFCVLDGVHAVLEVEFADLGHKGHFPEDGTLPRTLDREVQDAVFGYAELDLIGVELEVSHVIQEVGGQIGASFPQEGDLFRGCPQVLHALEEGAEAIDELVSIEQVSGVTVEEFVFYRSAGAVAKDERGHVELVQVVFENGSDHKTLLVIGLRMAPVKRKRGGRGRERSPRTVASCLCAAVPRHQLSH